MVRAVLASVALFGCNQVLGLAPTIEVDASIPIDADTRPDLDHDGVPDPIDPCVAPSSDDVLDIDQDGMANGVDPCPLDHVGRTGGDADADRIPDVCDPFPAAGGDELRCVMGFSDPALNLALWQPRAGDPAWMVTNQMLATTVDSTLIAIEPFETTETTIYDAFGFLDSATPFVTGAVRLYARASPAGSPTDAGCEISGTGTATHLRLLGGSAPDQMAPVNVNRQFRLRITIEPQAQTNVRCEATILDFMNVQQLAVSGHVDLTPGNVGFAAANVALVNISGLAIYHRSDAPPL